MSTSAAETGAFVVTLKDVWMEVNATQQKTTDALANMAASVADLSGRLGTIADAIRAGAEHGADLETRVRVLEKWRYQLPISLIMAFISLAAVLIDAISKIR